MKEQLITFDTAKLAKEKGFDELTKYIYFNGELSGLTLDDYNYLGDKKLRKNVLSAPTQSLLQKWLREKHNIQVCNNLHYKVGGGIAGYLIDISHPNGDFKSTSISENTYEEALEKGLQESLKLIES